MYQEKPGVLLGLYWEPGLEEIEMFTYQQIQAMREHRYGDRPSERHRRKRRKPEQGSLHELLTAVASGLASLGARDGDGKIRPASPA